MDGSVIFLKDFIYLFLERGKEGEREGEKHQCVVASCTPPTWDLAFNPGMYPSKNFGSQAGAQSTEPHQPGQRKCYYFFLTNEETGHRWTKYLAKSHTHSFIWEESQVKPRFVELRSL